MSDQITTRRLSGDDPRLLREMLAVFAAAFEDEDTYLSRPPSDSYLRDLASEPSFIAVAAFIGGRVVGGLVCYELRKLERETREFYIFDLAVLETHRRRGVASAMIECLRAIAAERGAFVIYVQADHGDDAAVALYERFGARREVLHFDIPVSRDE